MTDRNIILQAIYRAVSTANEALEVDNQLFAEENQLIIGKGAKLDSLGFVSLLVAVEGAVSEMLGDCPSLVENLSDPNSGVHTLGELADFIEAQMG